MSAPTRQLDQRIAITPRALWGMLSAAALIAGSIGAWATAGPFSIAGTASGGDGVFTLIVGVLLLPCVLVRRAWIAVLPLAAIASAVAIVDAIRVLRIHDGLFDYTIGWGVILVAIAGASLVAWGIAVVALRAVRGAWALGLLACTLAGTLVVLGASGRLDDPNAHAKTPAHQQAATIPPSPQPTTASAAPTTPRTPSQRATSPIAKARRVPATCAIVHVSAVNPVFASFGVHSTPACTPYEGDGLVVMQHTSAGWATLWEGTCDPVGPSRVPADVYAELCS